MPVCVDSIVCVSKAREDVGGLDIAEVDELDADNVRQELLELKLGEDACVVALGVDLQVEWSEGVMQQ